jgi:hypothetical protein
MKTLLRKSYVLDGKKELFQLNFYSTNEIIMFNFGKMMILSTFSSYEKLPAWIKENLDSEEALQIVQDFQKQTKRLKETLHDYHTNNL